MPSEPSRNEDWIIRAYYDAALRRREERTDPGWHHPSSAAAACMRQLQGRFIGMTTDNPVDAQMVIMAEIGNQLHAIGEDVVHHDHVHTTEMNLEEPSIPIRGRTDVLVNDWDDTPAIVDWKGCGQFPSTPKDEHRLQGAWYAYMAQVSRVVLVYIHRGFADARRFTLEWPELNALWEASAEQLAMVTGFTVNGELAPRTPRSRAQDCIGCPFLHACDSLEWGKEDKWRLPLERTARMLSGDQAG